MYYIVALSTSGHSQFFSVARLKKMIFSVFQHATLKPGRAYTIVTRLAI